jgi:FkbM family methyltransferase
MKTKFIQFILCFCFGMSSWLFCRETSYSHVDGTGVYLDEKLIKLMDYDNGVFVEAGANNGIFQSNTKRLEEFHGWTGVLVEPSPSLFQTLCTNRPFSQCFQCALGSFEEDLTSIYGDFDGNPMSSVNGERLSRPHNHKVPVRSLQSILDEVGIKHVNFMSLDTEGYELNILLGIDFAKTQFDYILIEIYKDQYDEIVNFLSEKGYLLAGNFSNYNFVDNPYWDGTHNDYLFKHREK